MIKDIHEFLTEAITHDATDKYDESVVNFVQLFNGVLAHELSKRIHRQESDISINIILNRTKATPTNMLLYIVVAGVNDVANRVLISEHVRNIIISLMRQLSRIATA